MCTFATGRVGLIYRDHFFRQAFMMRQAFDTMVTAPPLIWTQGEFDEVDAVIGRVLDLTLDDIAGELAA
jgi:putrescine---pyruvate transaminase